MKRQVVQEPDKARQKKRLSDNKSHAAKRKFEDDCKKLITFEPDSHDAYTPTAKQLHSWTGTIHAKMSEILRQIDAQSRPANTHAAYVKEIRRVHEDKNIRTKYEALTQLLSFKPPVEELRVVSEDNVLQELKLPCSIPICFTHTPTRCLSIEELIYRSSRNKDAKINVYDPSVQKHDDTTRKTTVEEFAQSFAEQSDTAIPKNFLDISNSTGIQFLPQSVLDICLETRCKRGAKSLGRDSEDAPENMNALPEFFIATKKGGFSPGHIDNFGKATCAIMLVGTKCWYIPSGDPWAIRRDHAAGEDLPGSQQLKIKLDVGTVL